MTATLLRTLTGLALGTVIIAGSPVYLVALKAQTSELLGNIKVEPPR